MRSYDALTNTLGRLGFSEIEASIYIDLLKHPGSTGYGIGKSIARPHANVYQGLNSLEQKGAVMFEDRERKTFTATPPDELLELIRRRFEEDCDAAAGGLDGLKAVESDQE